MDPPVTRMSLARWRAAAATTAALAALAQGARANQDARPSAARIGRGGVRAPPRAWSCRYLDRRRCRYARPRAPLRERSEDRGQLRAMLGGLEVEERVRRQEV